MKSLSHKIVLAAILALLCIHSFAQLPTITTTVDKHKILIGEPIRMHVQVTMPDNRYQLTWLTLPPEFGSFVLASKGKIDSSYRTGVLQFSQQLHVTSFDSGSQVIPPLAFHFQSLRGDSSFQMFTDSVPVEVMYSPADTVLPFHDIKPIFAVQKVQPGWFWPLIIAGVLIVLLILWLIFRRKRKQASTVAPALPAYDEAIFLINQLKEEDLPAKGEYKQYFVRLTDIFKRYITRTTGKNQMHLTGPETIAGLSRFDMDKQLRDDFAHCIRVADAVKFARYKPSEMQSRACLEKITQAIRVIDGSKKEEDHDL